MTSRSWFGWPIAAFCLILSSTTVSAASSTSMQAAAPECPAPRVPYAISFACAQAASAEAVKSVAAGAVNDPAPTAESAPHECPTPRVPYGISFACAQAASAEALNNVAPGAVNDPRLAAESSAPGCPTPRSQWEWFACAHAPDDTEVGPALVPSNSCADAGICNTADGDQ